MDNYKVKFNIIFFLIIIGLEFYIYSYNPVLDGDAAAYSYVLNYEKNGNGIIYGIGEDRQRIKSITDVINSQIDHYKYFGGRNLVHGIEQFFSGVLSPSVFYVINTFVLLITIVLMVYIAVGKTLMFQSYGPWVLTVCGLLFFLPWPLYILSSINLSCNYLWPMLSLLIVYTIWYYIRSKKTKYKLPVCILFCLIAFVSGWSHEAYCIALSGGFFFYYLFHYKELKGAQAWIVIGYWLGTLVLISSPGNFFRFDNLENDHGYRNLIREFMFSLTRLKCVYIYLFIIIYFNIKKKLYFTEFIKNYQLLIITWIISFVFIGFIHTTSHSFTGVEMLSILLITCLCKPFYTDNKIIILTSFMILLCIYMGIISVYQFKQNKSERNAIQYYANSLDGLTINYTKECKNLFISPFLCPVMDNFRYHPLTEALYSNNSNKMIMITPQDELIIKNPDKYFNKKNQFGNGPFYYIEGCSKVWAPSDSSLIKKDYIWIFDKPKWNEKMSMADRINAIINPTAVPKTIKTSKPEIIHTLYGSYTIINIPTERKIIGMDTKNN